MLEQQEIFFSEIEFLKSENQGLQYQIKLEQEKNKYYEEEVERLYEMLNSLKRSKYGKKSERYESSEQMVFNEAEFLAKNLKPDLAEEILLDSYTAVEDSNKKEILVKEHTKKIRGHRKPLPKNLPREVCRIELPESERVSADGVTPLKIIGYEVSEKLVYEPAMVKVLEIHRAKYGVEVGDYEKTAPHTPSIIPRSFVTPELAASIITQKYAYGLPLYRQEEMFLELKIDLPRQTQARWVIAHARALMPLFNILNDRLLSSSYISCDETYTQVLKENGKPAESTSYMWVRSTPHAKNKIILFEYSASRSSEVAKKLLEDFSGYVQVDGYGGYNFLEDQTNTTRIGCNMHGRRYFEQAKADGAKSGKTLAEVGLKFYQQIYDLDEVSKKLDLEEKQKHRLEKHKPIWDEFKLWVDGHINKVPPKSKLGKALNYFTNEYEYLIGYLKDPILEIDNGFVERAIRKFTIGRNNWMFSDTEAGASASSIFYSLLCTANVNGIKPYSLMKYIFQEIPKANTLEDIESLADIIMGIKSFPDHNA
jgi:transposase